MISEQTQRLVQEIRDTFCDLPQNKAWKIAYGKAANISDPKGEVLEYAYIMQKMTWLSRLSKLMCISNVHPIIIDEERKKTLWSFEDWKLHSRLGKTLCKVLN